MEAMHSLKMLICIDCTALYPRRWQHSYLYELQWEARSSDTRLRGAGTGATSKPIVKVSAKDRDKTVVRYPPEVTSRTSLLGAGSSDIHLQRASSSITPAEGGLRHLASGVGRLHVLKTKLARLAGQKLEKQEQQAKLELGVPGNWACLCRKEPRPGPAQGLRVVTPSFKNWEQCSKGL
jgi:hypothetical protein